MSSDLTTQGIHWPSVPWMYPGCAADCPGHADELTFTGVMRAVEMDAAPRTPAPWWSVVALVVGTSLMVGAMLAGVVAWVWTS